MKLSIKYKLSAIILIFVIISVFITSFVAIYRNQKYFTIFFQKKSNEKKISYKNKREKLFYLYSELSSKYENLYKTNISNDFGRFCENIKSDLIIESLPAQTETLSALSSKYKSKNILLIEKNNIIQIANDIN
ncbi:hypothetical protein KA977_05590, partial [Candidatus Dependentiae bacterium]|nr:hypothetical protein [Candidatus Dependentiae bacterium]